MPLAGIMVVHPAAFCNAHSENPRDRQPHIHPLSRTDLSPNQGSLRAMMIQPFYMQTSVWPQVSRRICMGRKWSKQTGTLPYPKQPDNKKRTAGYGLLFVAIWVLRNHSILFPYPLPHGRFSSLSLRWIFLFLIPARNHRPQSAP